MCENFSGYVQRTQANPTKPKQTGKSNLEFSQSHLDVSTHSFGVLTPRPGRTLTSELNSSLYSCLLLATSEASQCFSPFTSCLIGISPTSHSPMVCMMWMTAKLFPRLGTYYVEKIFQYQKRLFLCIQLLTWEVGVEGVRLNRNKDPSWNTSQGKVYNSKCNRGIRCDRKIW